MNPPRNTPWGKTPWGTPQQKKKIAEGIWSFNTASHGGFWVSPERLAKMPEKYRACAFFPENGPWFEEDCSWCGVVLSFPEEFSEKDKESAEQTYKMYYEKK